MMYEVGGRMFVLVIVQDDASLEVSLSDIKDGTLVGQITLDAQDVCRDGLIVQRCQHDVGIPVSWRLAM